MKKLFFSLILLIGVIVISSCSSEEASVKCVDYEAMARQLIFQSVGSQVTATDANNIAFSSENITRGRGEVTVIICSFRIARKKYNCKTGFGVCDFKWIWQKMSSANDFVNENNVVSSVVRTSSLGSYYVVLPIEQELSDEDKKNMPPLIVDDYVEHMETIDNKKQTISIKDGSYKYNPSIGKNGGFEVPVTLENIKFNN